DSKLKPRCTPVWAYAGAASSVSARPGRTGFHRIVGLQNRRRTGFGFSPRPAMAMQRPCQLRIARPPPRPSPASPLPGTLANNCGRGEERLGNSGTGMLRIAATAFLCAAFMLCAALLHHLTGSQPPATAYASAAEPHTVEIS